MIPDLETLKQKLIAFCEKRGEISFAYLFGSSVQGRTTPLSDIDIGVFISEVKVEEKKYPYGYEAHLASCLMSAFQTNRIDLVLLNEAPPLLQYQTFTQGILVYCRDPLLEQRVFVDVFRHYQDTVPLRRIQQFYLTRYLKNLGASSVHGSN